MIALALLVSLASLAVALRLWVFGRRFQRTATAELEAHRSELAALRGLLAPPPVEPLPTREPAPVVQLSERVTRMRGLLRKGRPPGSDHE